MGANNSTPSTNMGSLAIPSLATPPLVNRNGVVSNAQKDDIASQQSAIKGQTANQTQSPISSQTNKTTSNVSNTLKKVRQKENEVYSHIDTTLAILQKVPPIKLRGLQSITRKSYSFSMSPLGLLLEIIRHLNVSDEQIQKWLVNFIVEVLPAVEIGVKASLLANIKAIVSCSADPRIPKYMRKKYGDYYFDKLYQNLTDKQEIPNGIFINVNSIDPDGMLNVSPYSENGYYKYFGIEGDLFTTNNITTIKEASNRDSNEKVIQDTKKSEIFNSTKKGSSIREISSNATQQILSGNNGQMIYDTIGVRGGSKDVIFKDGSKTLFDKVVKRTRRPKWSLVRADDFNVFLWFAIHNGKLASPSKIEFNFDNMTAKVADINYNLLPYGNKLNASGNTMFDTFLLRPFETEEEGTSAYTKTVVKDRLKQGQTFIDTDNSNALSMCFGQVASDGDLDIKTSVILPVSSDWNSLNWYADKTNYYKRNIGYKNIDKYPRNYEQEKAICNIRYISDLEGEKLNKYIPGVTNTLQFTILPKPYTYVPYIDSGEPIWRIKRILFDAEGNPSKNGSFSLPTDKMTKNGYPYVRNENISALRNMQAMLNESKKSDFNSDVSALTTAIYDESYTIVTGETIKTLPLLEKYFVDNHTYIRLLTAYQGIKNWEPGGTTPMDTEAAKAKYLSSLKRMVNNRLGIEGTTKEEDKGWIDLTVGDEDDNCHLYINIYDGSYMLGTKEDKYKKPDKLTKHLIQCYNGLTVYEFNYDFIMSMKLFDPRVITAKLLSNATNPSYSANFSFNVTKNYDDNTYEYNGAKQRILEIVKNIIEQDDIELSDCFYTFSNMQYETMLQEAEEKRFHLQPFLKDGSSVDMSKINDILEGYDENGTLQEQKTVISNAIEETIAEVADYNEAIALKDHGGVRRRIATNILTQLASCIIDSILTPKVLLLIAVNKELMGNDKETLNAEDLLSGMSGLVIGVIKELRDLIVRKLLDYILDYLTPLAIELKLRILKEQLRVYADILSDLLAAFRQGKQIVGGLSAIVMSLVSKFKSSKKKKDNDYDLPTILDDVTYADIYADEGTTDSNEEPINNNC